MKIDGYSKHTHSRTLTRTCTSTHTHTQDLGKMRGKGGFNRHTFYKTRDYNINKNKKMEKTKTNKQKKHHQQQQIPPTTKNTNKPPTCRTGDTGHFRGRTVGWIECPCGASVEIFAITPATLGTGLSRWSG